MDNTTLSVSEFVALVNQTLEFAYPSIRVEGEVSEFRISKNRWVYFNLQDEESSVRMFGTVYQLSTPIEDGMKVVVKGTPRLHSKYGFSLNVAQIQPSGEGSIKKAFELLKRKLESEGLFAAERKRLLPDFPQRIGLITSQQSAAYADFMKQINQRWSGLDIYLADVQVQGESAAGQIVTALNNFSQMSEPVDVVVVTRGGGGAEDLMAFSTEEVARAVAASRIPTIVGVGHETDVSLADMVADVRATTPTNAAQLVVRDRREVYEDIAYKVGRISQQITTGAQARIRQMHLRLQEGMQMMLSNKKHNIDLMQQSLGLVNPHKVLSRGYSLVVDESGRTVRSADSLEVGAKLVIRFSSGKAEAEVTNVEK